MMDGPAAGYFSRRKLVIGVTAAVKWSERNQTKLALAAVVYNYHAKA